MNILRDSETLYSDSSFENSRAEMLKKFPSSGNVHHAAIKSDATSLNVVPKCGNSDKESSVVRHVWSNGAITVIMWSKGTITVIMWSERTIKMLGWSERD